MDMHAVQSAVIPFPEEFILAILLDEMTMLGPTMSWPHLRDVISIEPTYQGFKSTIKRLCMTMMHHFSSETC